MPKTIADLAAGTISATTQLEVQNGSDGQKITGQDLVDFVGANVSAIKSIQRGFANVSQSPGTTTTISTIDPNKSIVIINGSYGPGASASDYPSSAAYLSALTSTSFTAIRPGGGNTVFSWQVVEYN